MIAAFIGLALTFFPQAPQPTRHYVAAKEECGYEFDYPANWTATPLPNDGHEYCRVQLRPDDFAARMAVFDVGGYYTLQVSRVGGEFLEAAAGQFFDFVKGKWFVLGRMGNDEEAEVVNNARWHGLKGVGWPGCHSETRGYVGLCPNPVLVLRDSDDDPLNDIIWSMRGGTETSEVFDMIYATFKLVGP